MLIPRSFMHGMNDDRIMSRTCLRQRSVIITRWEVGGGAGRIRMAEFSIITGL